jgi:hypothetical protein
MANTIKESITIAAKLIKDNPGEECIETYYMIDEALDGRSVIMYSDETTDEEFKKDKYLVQTFFKFIRSMN